MDCFEETESDSTETLKEQLWRKFVTYMHLNEEVDRERFFGYLGIALDNVGFKKVKVVFKKGRRSAYTGLSLKSHVGKFKQDARTPVQPPRNATELEKVQTWMKNSFIEGDENDRIAKEDMWIKFQRDVQAKEVTKSVFFSLLGNTVFKNPPFFKVTGIKREGKVSHYQYLQERSHSTHKKTRITVSDAAISESLEDDLSGMVSDPTECVFNEVRRSGVKTSNLASSPKCENETPAYPSSESEEEKAYLDDHVSQHDDWDEEQSNTLSDSNPCSDDLDADSEWESLKSIEDDEEKEQNVAGVSTQTLPAIASGRVSSSKELNSQDIFKKFHKHLDHLNPSHLPGKPSSFQVYLNSLFLDPSNVVVERASIHSLSARASNYVDTRTRAFLAATFPPIKVGSLAGTDVETSFEGDIFPQFIHVSKGNFKCSVCIPYLKWAILNKHPHSVARARKAKTDDILEGTAEIKLCGLVQVQEHSVTKCHMEACAFWKDPKEKESSKKPLLEKEGPKKMKTIDQYFVKPSDPLN